MNPQPLTQMGIYPHSMNTTDAHYLGKRYVCIDDVRAAVEGLKQYVEGRSIVADNQAYIDVLEAIDTWFPAFADEKEEGAE